MPCSPRLFAALPLTDGPDLLTRSGLPESCRDDVRSLMALPRLAGTIVFLVIFVPTLISALDALGEEITALEASGALAMPEPSLWRRRSREVRSWKQLDVQGDHHNSNKTIR